MLSRDMSPKLEMPKPTMRLTDRDMPDLKKHEVGKKYSFNVTAEMQHHSQGDEYGSTGGDTSKEHRGTYVIHKIQPAKAKDNGKEDDE